STASSSQYWSSAAAAWCPPSEAAPATSVPGAGQLPPAPAERKQATLAFCNAQESWPSQLL
ncbi:MAG: hypothetical protein VX403_05200, partial [Planctomycetota bacterium]|nr:hypothetical protein [Planctomycetota bacterium]